MIIMRINSNGDHRHNNISGKCIATVLPVHIKDSAAYEEIIMIT